MERNTLINKIGEHDNEKIYKTKYGDSEY